MEVRIEKRYPLPVDAARAWAVLADLRAVAACMPGAAITGQTDERHYDGTVKVKVGPATAAFAGTVELLESDAAARRLRLLAKGADRGGSSATMELTAVLEPGDADGSAVLAGDARVIVNGKFAQFGGRLMGQVSDLMLAQFVDNFRAAALAVPVAAAPVEAATNVAATPSPVAAPVSAVARELDGLALAWALLKGWFAGLLGRRA